MKNQLKPVKTRPAPPQRAPTFDPAAALRPAPPPRRRASSPPPPRRRPGETPDARARRFFFFPSPRTRLPRLGRFPSPPGTGEPAGTGGDEEANLPFRDRACVYAGGAAGARVSLYGYSVRTQTETRGAAAGPARRTARRTTRRRAAELRATAPRRRYGYSVRNRPVRFAIRAASHQHFARCQPTRRLFRIVPSVLRSRSPPRRSRRARLLLFPRKTASSERRRSPPPRRRRRA